MQTPLLNCLLAAGAALALGAADRDPAASAPAAPALTPPLRWVSTGPLVSPVSDPTHALVSVKDPTVVFDRGRWHIYATTAGTRGRWSMVYLSFADWSGAAAAKPYYLDANPNLRGYHCAPQVFYFRPQRKWYLVYQSQQPTYSTAEAVDRPETWSAPADFFPASPPGTPALWLDYWVICDDENAYLFSSGDDGRWYRCQTRLGDFPRGFSAPVVVLEDPNRFALFEASCVYRLKGSHQYLAIIEAIGPTGRRYYRGFLASRLDGAWTPLAGADSWEHPFAGIANVTFEPGTRPWTEDISHGEILRDGCDETMTIDPRHLRLLYQGEDPAKAYRDPRPEYNLLPWQLALLRLEPPRP